MIQGEIPVGKSLIYSNQNAELHLIFWGFCKRGSPPRIAFNKTDFEIVWSFYRAGLIDILSLGMSNIIQQILTHIGSHPWLVFTYSMRNNTKVSFCVPVPWIILTMEEILHQLIGSLLYVYIVFFNTFFQKECLQHPKKVVKA